MQAHGPQVLGSRAICSTVTEMRLLCSHKRTEDAADLEPQIYLPQHCSHCYKHRALEACGFEGLSYHLGAIRQRNLAALTCWLALQVSKLLVSLLQDFQSTVCVFVKQ